MEEADAGRREVTAPTVAEPGFGPGAVGLQDLAPVPLRTAVGT